MNNAFIHLIDKTHASRFMGNKTPPGFIIMNETHTGVLNTRTDLNQEDVKQ